MGKCCTDDNIQIKTTAFKEKLWHSEHGMGIAGRILGPLESPKNSVIKFKNLLLVV